MMAHPRPTASANELASIPDAAVCPSGIGEIMSQAMPATRETDPDYISHVIAAVLRTAAKARASDIHFTPTESDLAILWRIDGVLHPVLSLSRRFAPNVAARLKVLANLLTYRTEIPQEGRIRLDATDIEMRLSTFPTLHGEKAVVRLFAGSDLYVWPEGLGLPDDVRDELLRVLDETSGSVLITGPAGSGKTTTAYACLRHLRRQSMQMAASTSISTIAASNGMVSGKSLATLEDPIESELPGVSQSQVNRGAGFDYATGIRSLLRQDPDVILVGEVRDRETAETVFQACLTGHLVVSTFHAGSSSEAISRLNDMGIEPYLLRAGLIAIICQRLFRKLCDCAKWTDDESQRLGFDATRVRVPCGCERCDGTGYRGRMLLAELLRPQLSSIGRAILSRSDATEIQAAAIREGLMTIQQRATRAVASGVLSPTEARRVLGFRNSG